MNFHTPFDFWGGWGIFVFCKCYRAPSYFIQILLCFLIINIAVGAALFAGSACLGYAYMRSNTLLARNKFPAGSNFPELKNHNNVMAEVLRENPWV